MKLTLLAFFACAAALAGCAGTSDQATTADTAKEEVYTPLGSMIAKKGKSSPDQTADLQQLENARLNTGTPRTGK